MNKQLINHYKCPKCEYKWVDVWDSEINSQCPECNTKDVQPYYSEDPFLPKKIVIVVQYGVAYPYISNIDNAEVRIYDIDDIRAGDDVEIGYGSDYPLSEERLNELETDVDNIKKERGE